MTTEDGIKIPILLGFSIHHRNPRRFGGKTTRENVSIVLRIEHNAWNVLFDNHSTSKVAELLNEYWKMFGDNKSLNKAKQIALSLLNSPKTKKRKSIFNGTWLRRIEKIGVDHSVTKRFFAWVLLFNGLSLSEVVDVINNVWIDPDRKLVIETIRIKKVLIIDR